MCNPEAAASSCPGVHVSVWSSSSQVLLQQLCLLCRHEEFPSLCQLCAGKGRDECACPPMNRTAATQEPSRECHETMTMSGDGEPWAAAATLGPGVAKPVDEYKDCHLAQVPSHTVVARSVGGKEDLIWELLNQAQEHFGKEKSSEFQLFGSPHGTDLLFTDAAHGFLKAPPKVDAKLYLGYVYFSVTQHLERGQEGTQRVQWCTVGHHERTKCDEWNAVSGGALACTMEETLEDCITAIMDKDTWCVLSPTYSVGSSSSEQDRNTEPAKCWTPGGLSSGVQGAQGSVLPRSHRK
ncbi:hypothetical protein P7K49_031591 [Saguinus oedipus]|uniref:Transferrin-like domain-containing protein n=1 Tax=Saguinus oedipus TaxID=9490 RepID=A0ABQ9TZU1_SAGOE|nr:hypothetical protein P7K49_031591 [Saguinus oedipus]